MTTQRTFAPRDPDLRGVRALVIGLGKSGAAASRVLLDRGAEVRAADSRPRAACSSAVDAIERRGARLTFEGHPERLADEADLVIASPGVRPDLPLIARARARGVPIWAEVELAARCCRGRIVGITGSNGKSTATSMVGAILRTAGFTGGTGGNLDTPFCELLADDADDAVHAVELSSFQLESVDALGADVAAVLNLTPDHIDRHGSLEAYAAAKARILETQGENSHAILNGDDPESTRFERSVRGRAYRVSTLGTVYQGAHVHKNRLVLRTDYGEETLMPADELSLPGEHNVSNALFAALAARLIGAPPDAARAALREFRPLPHRLEPVGTFEGVTWVDDSKATNQDASDRAVDAFPRGHVVLVLGGRDKGADWSAFTDRLRARVKHVLLIGEAGPAIAEALGSKVPSTLCGTLADAVGEARRVAKEGDFVLLSPACASFDQYDSFEARGQHFKDLVLGPDGRGRTGRA